MSSRSGRDGTGNSGEAPSHERHYTIPKLAKLWRMDPHTLRDIFRDEPGVITWHAGSKKRLMMRIPESVKVRVHRKLESRNESKPTRKSAESDDE